MIWRVVASSAIQTQTQTQCRFARPPPGRSRVVRFALAAAAQLAHVVVGDHAIFWKQDKSMATRFASVILFAGMNLAGYSHEKALSTYLH